MWGSQQSRYLPTGLVEHVFAVVKRLWGFTKVRYRRLAKNANRAFVALALANVYLSRRKLMALVSRSGREAGEESNIITQTLPSFSISTNPIFLYQS